MSPYASKISPYMLLYIPVHRRTRGTLRHASSISTSTQPGQLTGKPRASPCWHRYPRCQPTVTHRGALLFRKTGSQGRRWATRCITTCLTTDFCLQRAFQVQGCCYLHCSQVQRLPRGTRAPRSAALHPEITKRQFLPPSWQLSSSLL